MTAIDRKKLRSIVARAAAARDAARSLGDQYRVALSEYRLLEAETRRHPKTLGSTLDDLAAWSEHDLKNVGLHPRLIAEVVDQRDMVADLRQRLDAAQTAAGPLVALASRCTEYAERNA